jgi:lipopolysaccharide export LptBFGC system permease protein LptF
VVVKFSDSFAIKADLAPIIAVWIPNFIYCIIAIILWKKIQE